MPLTANPAPTTAERIRSTCVRAGGALLAIEREEPVTTPVHHLFDDGSFAVAVPVDYAQVCRTTGAQAVLELADYAPVPLREPVRSLVWIGGHLRWVPLPAVRGLLDLIASEHPNPTLLQVETLGSARTGGADACYALLRLEIASVVVTDATGAESVAVADLLAARPVLCGGVMFAAPPGHCAQRRGRPTGLQASRDAAARTDPAAGSRPVRRAVTRRG